MHNIIIVEDKKITREGMVQLIDWASIGAHISAAFCCGNEAIAYLEHHAVDLIISDIEMENGNGIDLLRFVHEHRPQTKVIIISAYERFSYAHDALSLGAFAYVLKPLDEKDLLEKVAQAFASLDSEHKSSIQKDFLAWERAAAAVLPWIEDHTRAALENALHALGESFLISGVCCFMFHSYSGHLSLHHLREVAAEIGQPVLLFPLQGNCCGFLSGALPASREVFDILCRQWGIGDAVRFGVSTPCASLDDWARAVAQARAALAYSYWNAGKQIVWAHELPQISCAENGVQLSAAALAKFLFSDDALATQQLLRQTFAKWKANNESVSYAVSQCASALQQLYSAHFTVESNPDFFENRQLLFENENGGAGA